MTGPIVAGALLATLALSAHGIGANAANLPAGNGTVPLPGARAVQQPPKCHGYRTYGVPRVSPLNARKTYRSIVVTNKGSMTITLLPRVAPIAVQSFIFLAQHHYFDGVIFHRIIPGFVIQGGDPTGTGFCGPGYEFRDEKVTMAYARGVLAMANAGPNTNGSQFFIVLSGNTGLPPNYTIFGRITSGLDTMDRIASVPLGVTSTGEKSRPLVKVYMKSVRVTVS